MFTNYNLLGTKYDLLVKGLASKQGEEVFNILSKNPNKP